MPTELIAHGLQTLGEVLVGITVIMVHHQVVAEHKIDERVFTEMRREQYVGGIGVALIIIGFLMRVPMLLNT